MQMGTTGADTAGALHTDCTMYSWAHLGALAPQAQVGMPCVGWLMPGVHVSQATSQGRPSAVGQMGAHHCRKRPCASSL